ncbi:flavin reductase [Leptospira ognonensis]|uniref:Flavin reductase n=1 Tax=Leptospira ognonensis TaxID=2484945 RepID=A0A4R9K0E7_9LEPT|nr:flavin reductase family protein [Leptospira ognonensis]TGL58162.1 flavin reductase [Leptospira ognonensis]
MSFDSTTFKSALSLWASGVTVICYRSSNKSGGITVSSFSSVSLDPPLVLFCLAKGSQAKHEIETSASFSVNILSSEQKQISADFASSSLDKEEVLNLLKPTVSKSGLPFLTGALVNLDCKLHQMIDAGDHYLVLGEVREAQVQEGKPLLYFNRNYKDII